MKNTPDKSYLNTLAICSFVWAGVLFLFSFVVLYFYVDIGAMVLKEKIPSPSVPNSPHAVSGPEFGWLLIIGGFLFTSYILAIAILNLLSAIRLSRRKSRKFSIVIGAINCLLPPIGLIFGVFTISVLSGPSAVSLYSESNPEPHSPWHGAPPRPSE